MPPLRQIQSTHTLNAYTNDLSQLTQRHDRNLLHHNRHQPYATCVQPPHMALPQLGLALPHDLVDKIMNTQEAAVSKTQEVAVSKTTQAKDASRLREFLQFCNGLGISSSNALPAEEDLLIAWAASYSGRLAGKTVSAKLGAIRKEHERRGLVWQGGVLLQRILKGVEALRPVSSLHSKGAPVSILMLEDLNRGLTAAGDVKPAAPTETVDSDSDDSSQSGDKAEPAIIVEDSSESDLDCDAKIADVVSAVNLVNGGKYHSHTFRGQIVICLVSEQAQG